MVDQLDQTLSNYAYFVTHYILDLSHILPMKNVGYYCPFLLCPMLVFSQATNLIDVKWIKEGWKTD